MIPSQLVKTSGKGYVPWMLLYVEWLLAVVAVHEKKQVERVVVVVVVDGYLKHVLMVVDFFDS